SPHRLAVPARLAFSGPLATDHRRSRRSAAPTLHQAAATAQQRRSLTTSRYIQRLVAHSSAPKKIAAASKISLARRSSPGYLLGRPTTHILPRSAASGLAG